MIRLAEGHAHIVQVSVPRLNIPSEETPHATHHLLSY